MAARIATAAGPASAAGATRGRKFRAAPRAPSLWKRILSLFGLGGDKPAGTEKKPKPAPAKKAARSAKQPARQPAKPKKKRAARAPEQVEVTTPRLYVGNLSYDTTEEDLEELFNGVGGVESAEVVTHRKTQRSKGFAFVVLRSVDEAKRAVDVLHDQEFMGRKIAVTGAKSAGPANQA